VKVSGVRPGETAAIFGVGGLGHLALQYARVFGGDTVAVDVEDAKLDLARELGATHTINARRGDPAEAIQALGGVDVAIALAANPHVLEHQTRRLDDVNRCFEEVLAGRVPARLVFRLAS
jgi:propanol-preferring alcohol dehydrogenase